MAMKQNPFNSPMVTGSAPSTGQVPGNFMAAFAKAFAGSDGKGSRGIRGPETPSLARSSAISRRLNGNPSRGTELKGL